MTCCECNTIVEQDEMSLDEDGWLCKDCAAAARAAFVVDRHASEPALPDLAIASVPIASAPVVRPVAVVSRPRRRADRGSDEEDVDSDNSESDSEQSDEEQGVVDVPLLDIGAAGFEVNVVQKVPKRGHLAAFERRVVWTLVAGVNSEIAVNPNDKLSSFKWGKAGMGIEQCPVKTELNHYMMSQWGKNQKFTAD
jgi:hypothetical protein